MALLVYHEASRVGKCRQSAVFAGIRPMENDE
jgi:hypothetical protein